MCSDFDFKCFKILLPHWYFTHRCVLQTTNTQNTFKHLYMHLYRPTVEPFIGFEWCLQFVLCRLRKYVDLQLMIPFRSIIEQTLKSSKLMLFSHLFHSALCLTFSLLLSGAEGYKTYWCVKPLSSLISCISLVKSVIQEDITAQQWTIYRDGSVLMCMASGVTHLRFARMSQLI